MRCIVVQVYRMHMNRKEAQKKWKIEKKRKKYKRVEK